jgi:PAS domain S-box-containing protein
MSAADMVNVEGALRMPSRPATVLVLDDGGRVLTWDGVAAAILGYPATEALGRKAQELLPDLMSPKELWQRGLAGDRIETRGLTKDGREISLEVLLTAYERGSERFVAAILRDQRMPRLEAERGLLHDRLAAVGELAAGMAHDYNNVLATIILYSEMLLASTTLTQEDHARVRVVLEQAQRGATLTTQVLDFTRRSDMERHPIDMKALMIETRDLLDAVLPSDIPVEVTFAGDRFVVNADPGRLQQMVMNLAINARDAMPGGGRLGFRVEKFRLLPEDPSPYRDMRPGDWVSLRVSDTGTGIPPEELPHVFEPFFTTKPPGKGTGLGLAQVYGIVKRHDGYVDAASQLGVGTTFTVYLPLDPREPEAWAMGGRAVTEAQGQRTALLIEDDEGTRPALMQVLQIMGFDVFAAPTGEMGLKVMQDRDGDVDMVVCNIHLPDTNGQELARSMSRRWGKPVFVLMSGYSLGFETRQDPLDPRFRWLRKPFTMAELGAAMGGPKEP